MADADQVKVDPVALLEHIGPDHRLTPYQEAAIQWITSGPCPTGEAAGGTQGFNLKPIINKIRTDDVPAEG